MSRFDLAEFDRRIGGLVRVGRVAETAPERAELRAEIGEVMSGWMPVLAPRAGADRAWWFPSIGEQILIVAVGGEPDQAVAVGGLYSDAHPAPAADPNLTRIVWEDGAEVEYDRAHARLAIALPEGGTVTIRGDVIVDGDVVAGGVSLREHTHGGVRRGSASTDPPNGGA